MRLSDFTIVSLILIFILGFIVGDIRHNIELLDARITNIEMAK